jgi:hypothetical protein
VTVEPYGSGNVNDTYLAVFRTTFSEQRFIVQRIRKSVFPNPEVIMQNMRVLTDHCHAKLEAEAEGADRIWQLPKIIQTKAGEDWVTDADGDLWRAISQIASADAYEKVRNPEHAHEAGIVLGHVCPHPSRADGVGRRTVYADVTCHRAHEPDEPVFGGAIGRHGGRSNLTGR